LADMAVQDPEAFKKLIGLANEQLAAV